MPPLASFPPAVLFARSPGAPYTFWLVVLRDGSKQTAKEILEFTNGRLGKSQRLSGVEIRDVLPRSTIGKMLKKDLRLPYWEAEKDKT